MAVAYSGRREGWTLRPPYLEAWMRRGGTKSPKETAMIKLIGSPSGLGICGDVKRCKYAVFGRRSSHASR